MKYKDTKIFWVMQYFNIPSLIIVIFKNNYIALVISLPLDRISNVPKILSNIWKTENWSYLGIIDQICDYAAKKLESMALFHLIKKFKIFQMVI